VRRTTSAASGTRKPLTGRGATRRPAGRPARTRPAAADADTLRCPPRPDGGRGPRPGDRTGRGRDAASERSARPRARSHAPSPHRL